MWRSILFSSLNESERFTVKFTRTAVALGAATLIAAGSVPAVQHFAEGDADKPVTTLSPAATTVKTSLPTPTTSTTTSATTSSATSSTTSTTTSPSTSTATSSQTSQKTPKVVETPVVSETPSTSTSPTAPATEDPEPTDEHPNVKPLGEAPKTYQGKDQRWVRILAGNRKNWDNEAIRVYSESMERDIPVAIFYARDEQGQRKENAPTVYLLNGAGGSEQDLSLIHI